MIWTHLDTLHFHVIYYSILYSLLMSQTKYRQHQAMGSQSSVLCNLMTLQKQILEGSCSAAVRTPNVLRGRGTKLQNNKLILGKSQESRIRIHLALGTPKGLREESLVFLYRNETQNRLEGWVGTASSVTGDFL